LKPDLVAPGERITSCAAGRSLAGLRSAVSTQAQRTPPSLPEELALATDQMVATFLPSDTAIPDGVPVYVDASGTSEAAPHVSGAIAAFLSIRREFLQQPDEVKRIFLESATPLGRERYFEGHGLVDLMRAIQSV